MLAQQRLISLQSGSKKVFRYLLFLSALVFHPGFSFSQSPGSAFTARLMNLEAAVSETFRYNATLHNEARQAKIYELKSDAPIGWSVAFKVEGSQVASFRLDSNRTQDISIEVVPSPAAKPGKYSIPLKAVSGTDTAALTIEAVVKGSYAVELTTPTGRLSDEVTEGSSTQLHLVVRNTGTIALDNLELSAQAPSQWEASFEPSKISRLDPGKTIDVTANLKVPDKTIAGDYVANFSIKNPNANASAAFRITVKTSFLSGWIGMLVILLAIAIIYYLIRKYGRR
ncbi:NEW3 domain-containing protein [Niabella pedocola]|uniref:NEW3 domain-containing protein n=1 Tax=Niabella pedocola TaxID=1752077 RepID=A0ABS8PSU7_9BACT|nr:NEW3 domain-containing protein [Niabella pedocola]MCD2424156.1 NEW3 domain-containing protein [Niabella pedocola]